MKMELSVLVLIRWHLPIVFKVKAAEVNKMF